MTPAIKAVAGVGSLCAIVPSSYAVYHVLSSSNTPSRKRLENNGYLLDPPKLNPKNIVVSRYGCADRLFKEMKVSGIKPDPSDATVYGCAIMFLETTQDNKLSEFNSHIAIRKGDKGWIINIDVNKSGVTGHTYIELNYSDNEWTQDVWSWSTRDSESRDGNTNKKLIIKVPGEDWSIDIDESLRLDQTNATITKEFSKAWISNVNKQDWILKGMMFAKGSEDKSQIFCPEGENEINNCFSGVTISNITKAQQSALDLFQGAKISASSSGESQDSVLKSKLKTTYQTLFSSKGSWKELNEICNYGNNGNINEDQQMQLEMFCAVMPSESDKFGFPPNIYPAPSSPLPSGGRDAEIAINLPS